MDSAEQMESRTQPPFWFWAIGNEGECNICHERIGAGELIGELNEEFAHEDCVQCEIGEQHEEPAS